VRWSKHSAYQGQHSSHLSPSKYHWLGYDDDKFDRVFAMQRAAQRGSELHDLAAKLIKLGVPLRQNGTTLSLYVNDAIGYRMRPEQTLVYSPNAFGQCDAISFRKKLLRIHDLKTGAALTSFKQLECYAALFCLEYMENPFDIKIELRIYQSDNLNIHIPDPDDIMHIMERYKYLDRRVLQLLAEEDEL
jgi:uncharacterized protein DUF2800